MNLEIKNYEDYREAVFELVQDIDPKCTKFCLDSVRDSYIDKVTVDEAAETVILETAYWEGDW